MAHNIYFRYIFYISSLPHSQWYRFLISWMIYWGSWHICTPSHPLPQCTHARTCHGSSCCKQEPWEPLGQPSNCNPEFHPCPQFSSQQPVGPPWSTPEIRLHPDLQHLSLVYSPFLSSFPVSTLWTNFQLPLGSSQQDTQFLAQDFWKCCAVCLEPSPFQSSLAASFLTFKSRLNYPSKSFPCWLWPPCQ